MRRGRSRPRFATRAADRAEDRRGRADAPRRAGRPRWFAAELERARVGAELGDLLLRQGRADESREVLRPALDLAWACGADALAERTRASLVQAGARPRRPELTGVRALTPAEARTARMAADGVTNRELAETLFVTEKTVETHLTAAYRKLNITGRAQLPAALGASQGASGKRPGFPRRATAPSFGRSPPKGSDECIA